MDVAFFFNSSSDFNNHYFILFFFLPFLAMPLPQLLIFFLFLYFGNGIATIGFSQFFFLPISAIPLPQLLCHNFFFLPISAMALPQLVVTNFFFSILAMSLPQIHSTFFLRNGTCTQFLQQILSARLLLLD